MVGLILRMMNNHQYHVGLGVGKLQVFNTVDLGWNFEPTWTQTLHWLNYLPGLRVKVTSLITIWFGILLCGRSYICFRMQCKITWVQGWYMRRQKTLCSIILSSLPCECRLLPYDCKTVSGRAHTYYIQSFAHRVVLSFLLRRSPSFWEKYCFPPNFDIYQPIVASCQLTMDEIGQCKPSWVSLLLG